MFIVSSFHDYYDTILSFGIDKTCVYNRKTVEVVLKNEIILPYITEWSRKPNNEITAFPSVIGFCGKLYPVVRVDFKDFGLSKSSFFYDAKSYIDFMKSRNHDPDTKVRWWFRGVSIRDEKGIKNFFDEKYSTLDKLFAEHKTPIFRVYNAKHGLGLTLNPKLKDYDFVKAVDPATAFQEIYMYKAGVLGNTEVDTVQISDKDMLKQKGFDKWSFKTMKGDKKPRAKNRNKE